MVHVNVDFHASDIEHWTSQVLDRDDPKTERWLSWNDYGPDQKLDIKTLQSIAKSLQNLEVPHLFCSDFYTGLELSVLRGLLNRDLHLLLVVYRELIRKVIER